MRCFKLVGCLVLFVSLSGQIATAQGFGLGSKLKSMFSRSDSASSSRTRVTTSAAPTAQRQSKPTFAPNELAPQASVTLPAPTSPTGDVQRLAQRNKPSFGSRFRMAAASARDALTIKPREIPANDPVRLDNMPRDVEAPVFVSAARVFESRGQRSRAKEHYEKALKANPKHLDALVGLARLEHRDSDLVAATELYQRALQAHPGNAMVLNDLGLCYARRNKLEQARKSLAAAVKKEPHSKLYRNNLSLILVEMNRNDDALRELRAVHPNAVAHYNLAFLLRESGYQREAALHLQTALKIEPRLEPAKRMLAQLSGQQADMPIASQRKPEMARPPRDNRNATRQPPHPPQQQWNASHRQEPVDNPPASVKHVRVRYPNDNAADYRHGSQAAPLQQPSVGAPVYNRRLPQASPNAPLPGEMSEHMRQQSSPAPQASSQWNRQR